MLKAKDQGHKCKFSSKKKIFKNFIQAIAKQNGLEKKFSANLQNFNHSKNSAILEPRTGQFSRTWGFEAKDLTIDAKAKAKDFKSVSSRTPPPLHAYLS